MSGDFAEFLGRVGVTVDDLVELHGELQWDRVLHDFRPEFSRCGHLP
jgi:hypothetical protein